jgi:hypothetical protein
MRSTRMAGKIQFAIWETLTWIVFPRIFIETPNWQENLKLVSAGETLKVSKFQFQLIFRFCMDVVSYQTSS